jgi:Holliday junction resolvase RusA-like endonuclease
MTQRSKWSPQAKRSLEYQRGVAQVAALCVGQKARDWRFVEVEVWVYLAVTAKGELPENRGDWDNYAKAVCDGIQYAEVLMNDRCILDGHAHVRPCATKVEERVEVAMSQVVL